LPPSIEVYEGQSRGEQNELFRAWRVEIDYSDETLQARALLSSDPSGRETTSAMAQKVKALVAVNGGYFDMQGSPAKTYSLVLRDGTILSPSVERVRRGSQQFFVTRSAFGIREDRTFDIAWVGNKNGKTYAFDAPILKPMKNGDSLAEQYSRAHLWDAQEAIGAGPRLIQNGKIHITFDEELFPGSGFERDVNYPRCAVGYTAQNKIILFVTGYKRGENYVGLTLPQLAKTLRELGCVEAMNLDGGGSETLVVNGALLNRPPDGTLRAVTSIFAIVR